MYLIYIMYDIMLRNVERNRIFYCQINEASTTLALPSVK